MGGVFYNLGKMAGPVLRKGKWVLQSLTGSEADVIRAEFEVGRDMAEALQAEAALDTDTATVALLSETGARLAQRLTNRKRLFPVAGSSSMMSVPVMSLGIKSGVH